MDKQDLRKGQTWKDAEGREYRILHLATAGAGDSVAWDGPDGPGGGPAGEFVRTHALAGDPPPRASSLPA